MVLLSDLFEMNDSLPSRGRWLVNWRGKPTSESLWMANGSLDVLGMKAVTTVVSHRHFGEQVFVRMHFVKVVFESSSSGRK